ncbi:MAG: hypothetical protein JWM80_5073 [Cyanobacteria bacterium RYN_339]|nr:hypothetical protein [Cyanobacteria bacterium RYN_339]
MDRPVQAALVQGLVGLAGELSAGTPLAGVHANVTKLVGMDPDEWRLRVGDYRVRFRVEIQPKASTAEQPEPGNEGVVVVVRLGHRRDVYRD